VAHEPRALERRRGEREVAVLLVVSILCALGLAATYWQGGQVQIEGALLLGALGSLAVALVLWAHRLLPQGPDVEPRDAVGGTAADQEAVGEELDRADVLHRRPVLRGLLLGAVGAFGVAALFPIRSLGPRPGNSLRTTAWRAGRKLVDSDGNLVRADQVPIGGLVTVFPEGATDAADSVAVLIRLAADNQPQPLPGRESWTPDGFVAYSKVCTHAGCPVGLYLAQSNTLLCPCHQSAFDVLHHAKPTSGPAARALPQLPLAIDETGVLHAQGDFSGAVGPSWWSM
jgi:ubiquinol-cytochrome c reductase iron-sulfur subunit